MLKPSRALWAIFVGGVLAAAACGPGTDPPGRETWIQQPDTSSMDVSDVVEETDGASDASTGDVEEGDADARDGGDVISCMDKPEQCNDEDDNCNGVVDEGCGCAYEETETGVCSEGTIGAEEGNCQPPESYEQDESACDGKDNDCDGMVDEGCPCNYDGNSEGVCANGVKSPDDGSCQKPDGYMSADEDGFNNPDHCDGKDNDCDGAADEGCTCNYGDIEAGVCGEATRGYVEGTCQKPPGFESEESSCDGEDNDCDGEIDESCSCVVGATNSCYTGPAGTKDVGACSPGERTCTRSGDDAEYGDCEDETLPSGENCTDGIDNDCDGKTDMADEACTCTIGATQPCYTGPSGTAGVGICKKGTQTCIQADDGSEWGECKDETLPGIEVCGDATDNDCDGEVDESSSVVEDFEGSDTGWSKFNNGTGTVNVTTSASTAHNGSEAAKATGPNQGVCGQGGISKSFNFTQTPGQMTVWVKGSSSTWGRVSIMLKDSSGITTIWREKASGDFDGVDIDWTKKTFDLTQYTNESSFTLIFGNDDNSSPCSNGDHTWTLWVDDIDIQQPSCSGS